MTQAAWRRGATDALFWSLLYTALWALFAAGQGWVLGVPTITLAVALSLWLGLRPMTLRLASLPAFLGFFLKHMLLGGWAAMAAPSVSTRPSPALRRSTRGATEPPGDY